MSKNFSIRRYMNQAILAEVEAQEQQEMQAQQQGQPQQQQPQAPQPNNTQDGSGAFRSLQGQTIAGVQYAPNGSNGGTVKIKVKNSYVPFTISWVNQQVTVTDLQGNTIVLGENQQ